VDGTQRLKAYVPECQCCVVPFSQISLPTADIFAMNGRLAWKLMKGFKRGFSKFYNPLSGTNPIETDLD